MPETAYKLTREEPVAAGVARVMRACVDDAVDRIDDALAGDPAPTDPVVHEAVHETRKRCKEVRAAARLVRTEYDGYKETNVHFRDLARLLSDVRDANAIVETYDEFIADRLQEPEPFRERLVARRDRIAREEAVLDRLAEARERLLEGRATYAGDPLALDAAGFEAISGGLQKSYRRGCDRLAEARQEPSAEVFHEWRKRVKYHWYHTLLLRDAWPTVFTAREDELKRLSDALGDEHDLAVFLGRLAVEPDLDAAAPDDLRGEVAAQRLEFQQESFAVGRRTHAESPAALADRVGEYWRVWRDDDPATTVDDPERVPHPSV
jgi:CHAD domain-containing protein